MREPIHTYLEVVSILKATRNQEMGIPIAEVATAFTDANWSKEEVESLVRELAQRYE